MLLVVQLEEVGLTLCCMNPSLQLRHVPPVWYFPPDFSCLLFFACREGEDPLAGDQNDHDMDSIAGVLKLYFRGLEHPLFPKDIFHDLIACVSK